MKKIIVNNLWAVWLGFAIGYVGFDVYSWQFWFMFVPTLAFVAVRDLFDEVA
jgi:hypothetical protein